MINRSANVGLALLALIVVPVPADDSPAANLVVHASGFTHQRGQAIARLFYEGDDIFKTARQRAASAIQKDMAVLIFPNILPGNYAVLVFHDRTQRRFRSQRPAFPSRASGLFQ